jgi:hypothetical protein
MRNGVLTIKERLSIEFKREYTWQETIDQILLYNKDATTRIYLNKLREEGQGNALPSLGS